jgi:16S rRNA A1518/A1519 N6-dimethyltransferase RsmA/KsgA/DIM1 with predicted DNA glycosylase/AP lyase activity
MNALSSKALPKNVLADAMAEAGLSPTARAEELTMAQFVQLSDALPDGCVAPR